MISFIKKVKLCFDFISVSSDCSSSCVSDELTVRKKDYKNTNSLINKIKS